MRSFINTVVLTLLAPAAVMGQGGFITESTTPSLTASASNYPQQTVGSKVVSVNVTSALQTEFDAADPGAFINFATGIYTFPAAGITISKAANVRCPTGGCVFKCATDCFVLDGSTTWSAVAQTTIDQAEYGDIVFKNNATGAECVQSTPYALNATFEFAVQQPVVKAGNLELPVVFTKWFNSRRMFELSYGTCAYSTTASTTLAPFKFYMKNDCTASGTIKVAFNQLETCIGANGITDAFPNVIYSSRVNVDMIENLRNIDADHALRAPANRRGSTYANVAVSIDTVQNVSAVVTANTPVANIEAKIVLVDIGSENGVNESRVVLELDTPQPFTLNGGDSLGPVLFSDNLDASLVTSQYNVSASCTGTAVGPTLLCKQTMVFIATGCDLTASYQIQQLTLQCAVGSEVTCPLIEGYVEPVDVNFYIATDNFCTVNQYDIASLFSITIVALNSSGSPVAYSSLGLTLGDKLNQAIVFNQSVSGVGINDAAVIDIKRTSNGFCDGSAAYSNYAKNYNDGNGPAGLNQTFDAINASVLGDNITYVFLNETVSAAMACATANSSSNQITQVYTVRVSYTDGRSSAASKNNPNARKRRDQIARRASGDMSVASDFGIQYSPEQLQATTASVPGRANFVATPAATSSSSTMYMIIAAVVVLMILCCCCVCCVAGGALVLRKREQQREKEAAMLAQQSVLGFGPNSNMCFTPQQM